MDRIHEELFFMGHVTHTISAKPNVNLLFFSCDQTVEYSSYLVELHTLKLKQYMPTILNPTVEATMN